MVVPTLLWADLTNRFVWMALLATLAFAAIGFADDYLKVVHHRNLGTHRPQQTDAAGAGGVLVAVVLVALEGAGRILHASGGSVPQKVSSRPDHSRLLGKSEDCGFLHSSRSSLSSRSVIVGSQMQ